MTDELSERPEDLLTELLQRAAGLEFDELEPVLYAAASAPAPGPGQDRPIFAALHRARAAAAEQRWNEVIEQLYCVAHLTSRAEHLQKRAGWVALLERVTLQAAYDVLVARSKLSRSRGSEPHPAARWAIVEADLSTNTMLPKFDGVEPYLLSKIYDSRRTSTRAEGAVQVRGIGMLHAEAVAIARGIALNKNAIETFSYADCVAGIQSIRWSYGCGRGLLLNIPADKHVPEVEQVRAWELIRTEFESVGAEVWSLLRSRAARTYAELPRAETELSFQDRTLIYHAARRRYARDIDLTPGRHRLAIALTSLALQSRNSARDVEHYTDCAGEFLRSPGEEQELANTLRAADESAASSALPCTSADAARLRRMIATKAKARGVTAPDLELLLNTNPAREVIAQEIERERHQRARQQQQDEDALIVCPGGFLPAPKSDRDFEGIAQQHEPLLKPLPLTQLPSISRIDDLRATLEREMPHATAAITAICDELDGRVRLGLKRFALPPLLLVGPPGSGKSHLALKLADSLGLARLVLPGGGDGDSKTLSGTSRGWGNGRPGSLPTLLARSKTASAIVVVDEIDKARRDTFNDAGLQAYLLGLLDPLTAKRHRDSYLCAELDLSGICWIATANRLSTISDALLSRMRVIHIPQPQRPHYPAIAESVLSGLSAELGVPRDALPTLRELNLDLALANSIRDLKSLVQQGVLHYSRNIVRH